MSSEQPKLNDSEANNQTTTSDNSEVQPQQPIMSSQTGSAAQPQPETDDADESRSAGDVDFGQLLDQFEQEQATLKKAKSCAASSWVLASAVS